MTSRIQINAEQTFTKFVGNERKRKQGIPAELGDGNGVITHPTRSGFVKARLYGDNRQIISVRDAAGVPTVEDTPILVEKVITEGKSFYKYVGRNDDLSYASDPMVGTIGSHAAQHVRADLGTGGFDPLDVYNRALIELRAQAQTTPDMTLAVNAGEYILGTSYKSFAGGNSAAFTAPAGWRVDLLYLDSANALQILQGANVGIPPATKPTPPANCLPLAWVWLISTTTAIDETLIEDARPMFGAMLPVTTLDHAVCVNNQVVCNNNQIVWL